jgi:hypothetical protein
MKQAAETVVGRLIIGREALILTQPGVLARYQLDEVVVHLVERALLDDAPSVLLINPTDDGAPPATVDASTGSLAVPLTSAAQRLRVPQSWIDNVHRGAA